MTNRNANTNPHLELFGRCWSQTRRIADAVTPADLDRPTPCTELGVRELLHHLVFIGARIEHVGNGGFFADITPATAGIPDDELQVRLDQAVVADVAAWADAAKLEQTFTVPWGTVPGPAVLGGYSQEVLMHGWDLAQGIGYEGELDAELATEILPISQMVLPADRRGDEVPFGPVVEVPDDADPYLRLAGWLGRRPLVTA